MKDIAIDKIDPNPWRHLETYELSEEKIEELIESIKKTGFWKTVAGRPNPEDKERVQIAFGHHRVEAARRLGLKSLLIDVQDLTDEALIQMMASENSATFSSNPFVSAGAIAAVVEAYAAGKLSTMEDVDPKTPKHLIYPTPIGVGYTLTTVARFLGWTKKSSDGRTEPTDACRRAFDLFRETATTQDAIKELPIGDQTGVAAEAVVMAVKAARFHGVQAGLTSSGIHKVEREAAKRTVQDIKENTGKYAKEQAVSQAKAVIREIVGEKPKPKPPDISVYANRIILLSQEHVGLHDRVLAGCRELVPFIDDLDVETSERLAQALEHRLSRTTSHMNDIIRALRRGKKDNFVQLLTEGEDQ